MVGMILVDNMGARAPWFLEHPEWDGFTPADLIFPAFLFIMGLAIPLAVNENRPIKPRNAIRIAGLFLIGFFLNLLGRKFDFTKGKRYDNFSSNNRNPTKAEHLLRSYNLSSLYHKLRQPLKKKVCCIFHVWAIWCIYSSYGFI